MWKSLLSRHVLKTLRGSLKRKTQREQYLLAMGLGCYKWYQSQTLDDVLARRLSPEGGWIGGSYIDWRRERSASEDETFFIRVWKPLPSRGVLKILRGSPKKTISASGGLGSLQPSICSLWHYHKHVYEHSFLTLF